MRKRSTDEINLNAPILLLKDRPAGYQGPVEYTTDEAPGAWPNGTRVRKRGSDSTDAHQDGAGAVVVGSIGPMPAGQPYAGTYGYFVSWDDTPGVPALIAGPRLERVTSQSR